MVLSAIENKLQWLEQELSEIAAREGITLEAVRSSISEMQEAILREVFDQLSDGDPDCLAIVPSGFRGPAMAFHEECHRLGVGGVLVLAIHAIDSCRGLIEHEPASDDEIISQLCAAVRLHEQFQNLLMQRPALREAWGELLSESRTEAARKTAAAKHAADPRQSEKAFVRQCWEEWQADSARYLSKAAFARDMLDKCKVLRSTKKIEDWCRSWEKG